ncbi:MAG: hypothetical protein ACPG4U_03035 [Pseudomonadales bacterium]
MNVTNALQTGLIGLNRGLDNNPRASSDFQGVGKADIPELASGRELDNAVAETTLEANTAAASTKVVTSVSDVLGTNIDVVV